MKRKKGNRLRLDMWQRRFSAAEDAYRETLDRMDRLEKAYRGEVDFNKLVENEATTAKDIKHIRNVIGELIEAQVDSAIPQPKVTALYERDEKLAKVAEDMLRCEMERMPVEEINDLCERISPIQGGVYYLVEWDNAQRTHDTVGELKLTALHPKQIIPQDGVYTSIEDMDYIFVKIPQTKDYIRRKYGVHFADEDVSEAEPELRQADADEPAPDLCTQILAYYRSESGVIGLFSWVEDIIIADYDDYQARKGRRCASCGEPEPPETTEDAGQREDLLYPDPDGITEAQFPGPDKPEAAKGVKRCPKCGGSEYITDDSRYELITEPFVTADGENIAADPMMPVKVRWYKPDVYPIVLQRNVTAYGSLLGASDVDMIYSQQQTLNRIEKAIIDKALTGGTITYLPPNTQIKTDNRVGKHFHVGNPAEVNMIGQVDLTADIKPDVAFAAQVYEEMRQAIGITDSFQGRSDSTATSKVAKEFAARQSAGRLESKRRMKDTAYARLFEIMFKFKLAYTDEDRPVRAVDERGRTTYEVFRRRDYIRRDAAGELYIDDSFLFSVDSAASLASNREAMWQETRMNLQTGAFGDPAATETLHLFWTKMEMLHYPGASETKRVMEERLEAERRQAELQHQQMMMQQRAAMQQQAAAAAQQRQEAQAASLREARQKEEAERQRIDDIARKDAARDALARAKEQKQAAAVMAAPAGM